MVLTVFNMRIIMNEPTAEVSNDVWTNILLLFSDDVLETRPLFIIEQFSNFVLLFVT